MYAEKWPSSLNFDECIKRNCTRASTGKNLENPKEFCAHSGAAIAAKEPGAKSIEIFKYNSKKLEKTPEKNWQKPQNPGTFRKQHWEIGKNPKKKLEKTPKKDYAPPTRGGEDFGTPLDDFSFDVVCSIGFGWMTASSSMPIEVEW